MIEKHDTPGIATRIAVAAMLAGLLCVNGCVGYRLGSSLPPGLKSVFVPVFVNDTGEPGLEALATSAAIAEIQKDGSLKIAPKETADTVLEVHLRRYTLDPLRFQKDQVNTAREYRLTLVADVVLRKTATGETLVNARGIAGYSDFPALTDLPSARRTALPATATDLAHRIVRSIVEYW